MELATKKRRRSVQSTVNKLYLPPGARYFGCRHCHGLVYRREPDPLEHADHEIQVIQMRLNRLNKKHGW